MKNQMEDMRSNADITTNRNDIRSTADMSELCAIRKPAFKKVDRKFMMLLPSFNGKEIRRNQENLK